MTPLISAIIFSCGLLFLAAIATAIVGMLWKNRRIDELEGEIQDSKKRRDKLADALAEKQAAYNKLDDEYEQLLIERNGVARALQDERLRNDILVQENQKLAQEHQIALAATRKMAETLMEKTSQGQSVN
jgi:biopolymer transport protein ExbB/TolQ